MARRVLARVMHPDLRWVDDHLRLRSACLAWVEPDGARWVIRSRHFRLTVGDKAKAVRWLERWASRQTIRTRYPRTEVPGFRET